MPLVLSFVSQKGGVAKSSLAQLVAVYCAKLGSSVVVVDLDGEQQTSVHWNSERTTRGLRPPVTVVAGRPSDNLLALGGDCDVLIFDAPGRASQLTLKLAEISDLVVQPTGAALADLKPAVDVFRELEAAGMPRERMAFALAKMNSDAKEGETRAGLGRLGFNVLKGAVFTETAYENAMDGGKTLADTGFKRLDADATTLANAIVNEAVALREGQGRGAKGKDAKADDGKVVSLRRKARP